ncbi:MAG TPA: GNAT family N-acetyltransferase [Candidatus Kapabacteria bacterium]|nr:GNAT family N-acetyltransferase [Candidatus Kapabacteria bacterium]
MTNFTIRFITLADAEAVRLIYLPYVRNTSITFEVAEPTPEEFVHRVETITAQYPWIVYEENGEVLGYAYGCRHRAREAYDWSAESAIYVKEGAHGRGIGKKLYQALFALLKAQGYVNIYGGVTQPNENSNKLHEAVGFTELGRFKNIGYKHGKWHDTKWYELALQEHSAEPAAPKPMPELIDSPAIATILDEVNRSIR